MFQRTYRVEFETDPKTKGYHQVANPDHTASRPRASRTAALALNKLIGENDEVNAKTLPKVKMPNRDGFIICFPDKVQRLAYCRFFGEGGDQ